jgi:hypothetical protein
VTFTLLKQKIGIRHASGGSCNKGNHKGEVHSSRSAIGVHIHIRVRPVLGHI